MKMSAHELLKVALLAMVLTIVGCGGGRSSSSSVTAPGVITDPNPIGAVHRYALANQCFAIISKATGDYVSLNGGSYAANASELAQAIQFFLKPSALGEYLLYHFTGEDFKTDRGLLTANTTPSALLLENATDEAIFVLKGAGDDLAYPEPPQYDTEPTPELVAAYRDFDDPMQAYSEFTLAAKDGLMKLAVDENGALTMQAPDDASDAQIFSFERLEYSAGCPVFPEALSNVAGELESPLGLAPSFKGTTSDGNVLGHADVHVHWTSSTFLGNAQAGDTFHKFGVTHALEDCEDQHGPGGERDGTGSVLSGADGDNPQHFTDGWPTFTDWPARGRLTHEAMYWKWVERAWQAGLRVMVNDLVDNETLCELTRSINEDNNPQQGEAAATEDCNSMQSARDQIGTSYALQDYIDAQYGGRGKGFMRIVLDPAEARQEVVKGNMAVVLGLEISNTLNCKVIFAPNRTLDAFEETGAGGGENRYTCTTEESGDGLFGDHPEGSVMFELKKLWQLGVRQFISIHEFDNAFGGNGLFFDVLNAGTMENSGGIQPDQAENAGAFGGLDEGTGEFWSTYACPEEGDEDFNGYFWGSKGGTQLPGPNPPGPGCQGPYRGQTGKNEADISVNRPGGQTLCYPSGQQCNARWMTPIGLYTFRKLMEFGFVFDFDHFELEMKDQALELAEAQPIPYPFVSTHGTFGGITNDQARRVFANGGLLYPSIGSSNGFLKNMNEAKGIFDDAMNDTLMQALGLRPTRLDDAEQFFAFGYGTDTNGASAQSAPRTAGTFDGREVGYPYALFADDNTTCVETAGNICNSFEPFWATLTEFSGHPGVVFERPAIYDPTDPNNADGNLEASRMWHEDVDGNAQYGMFSGMVQELRLAQFGAQDANREELGSPTVSMQHLFNSAELYLRVWERTVAASQAINDAAGTALPPEVGDYKLLRPAPVPALPIPE